MKLRRFMLLGVVVVLSAGWAQANTIPPDPGIIIVRETVTEFYQPLFPGTTTFPVVFQTCPAGFSGDGCAGFENDTGNPINSIGLSINYFNTSSTGQALSCASNDSGNPMDTFTNNNCPATVPTTNPFSVVYFGGPGVPTEPPITLTALVPTTDPSQFAIVAFGWGTFQGGLPEIAVDATLNAPVPAVPEPATLALLLTGIGAIAARRKLRKGRGSRA
jgi:hypothetical protein